MHSSHRLPEMKIRKAAKLIPPAGTALGAIAILTTIHQQAVDAGADVALVASLLALAHTAFRLVDDA
jgi:uncharacterized membrane protein (UPF0136 family)